MQIISQILQLALDKRKVAEIDYHPLAAVLAIALAVATAYYLTSTLLEPSLPFSAIALQHFTACVFVYLLLLLQGKQNRFVQCILALMGVSSIIQLAGVLVIATGRFEILLVALYLWSIYIFVNIFRQVADCRWFSAIAIWLCMYICVNFVNEFVYTEEMNAIRASLAKSLEEKAN